MLRTSPGKIAHVPRGEALHELPAPGLLDPSGLRDHASVGHPMSTLLTCADRHRGDTGGDSEQDDGDQKQLDDRTHAHAIGRPDGRPRGRDSSRSARPAVRARTIGMTLTLGPHAAGGALHSASMNVPATSPPDRLGSSPGAILRKRSAISRWIGVCLLTLAILCERGLGQTSVTFDTFGLGNCFRPGGPVAARVLITSDLDAPMPGLVEWEIPNPDGDRQINQRTIEIPARGGTATTWLLGDLPSRIDPLSIADEPWTIRVFEYRDGRRVEEIASARLDPSVCASRPIPQSEGLAIVIGPNEAGLTGYTTLPGRDTRPGLNELLNVVTNVEPRDLPDLWSGFEQADFILWTADDPRFQPGTLGTRLTVEGALRSWLDRGGHLVIALPRTGDPWRLERGDGVLDDLLRGVTPITESDYPLAEALPALADRPELRDPDRRITLHRFDPATLPPAWRPLAGFQPAPPPFDPDTVDIPPGTPREVAARLIDSAKASVPKPPPVIHAIRRDVGQGTLDIIGIDPSDPDLRVQQPQGLPATWVFWNPILGRRTFTPTGSVVDALATARQLAGTSQATQLGASRLVEDMIGQQSSASGGLLLGIALFGGYWLLAGPLGFAILGRLGRRRDAWIAFVATSLVGAFIGWMLGGIAIDSGTSLRHLTVLRHRYAAEGSGSETPLDHATCWFSAHLQGYGTSEVAVGDPDEASSRGAAGGDLLAHFSPPPNGFAAGFLDAARYEVDVRRRSSIVAPARETSADFVADWSGRPRSPSGVWGSTIKVAAESPVQLEVLDRDLVRVSGRLVNDSGVTLEEVVVLLVSPVRPGPLPLDKSGVPGIPGTNDRLTAQMPNLGSMVVMSTPWAPGEARDLGGTGLFGSATRLSQFGRSSLGSQFNDRFPPEEYGFVATQAFEEATTRNSSRVLQALSCFQALEPPPIVMVPNGTRTGSRFFRLLGRNLDLSRALSEPCVVILAIAKDAPCPVPINIDGELVEGDGTVLLQWVHPLPSDVDLLVPPRPDVFTNDADGSQASHLSIPSQPQGVAAAWR